MINVEIVLSQERIAIFRVVKSEGVEMCATDAPSIELTHVKSPLHCSEDTL